MQGARLVESLIAAPIAFIALFTVAIAADLNPPVFVEVEGLRDGVRGDDIIRTDDGYFVAGWAPGATPQTYIALLNEDLSKVLWESFPPGAAGGILMSVAYNEHNGNYYVAGFASHEGVENYDPLIMQVNKEGALLAKWHPDLGGNHTLWDIHWDPQSGDLFAVGETNYHEDDSQMFAVRLTEDLNEEWRRAYAFDADRTAAYALAPVGGDFVLAGGSSKNGEDGRPRYPALLTIDEDGVVRRQEIFEDKVNTIYHWVRSADDGIFAGGYGVAQEGAENDIFLDILGTDYSRRKSTYFGWNAADHSIHSILCGGVLYYGGFTRSFSDGDWQGLALRQASGAGPVHSYVMRSDDLRVALRNFACAGPNEGAVYVGFVAKKDGAPSLIVGRIPK